MTVAVAEIVVGGTGAGDVLDVAYCSDGFGLNWSTATECGLAAAPVVSKSLLNGIGDLARALSRSGDEVADVAQGAGRLCSFAAKTEVLMADGSTKPIAAVEIGDWVLAEDPETGERGARRVTHLWVHEDILIDLKIDGHDVVTTENHPFWNQTDREWQRADALDEGDSLLTAAGGLVSVEGVDWSSSFTGTAFNLTVDGIHTYFVAVAGEEVLVHNTGTCLPRFNGPKPTYHVNNAHVPGQGLQRGKTPLPSDAGDVYKNAVPNDPHDPTAWFGRNAAGQTYRFSPGNDGTAHFSGIDGVGDGVRNLTDYATARLDLLGG